MAGAPPYYSWLLPHVNRHYLLRHHLRLRLFYNNCLYLMLVVWPKTLINSSPSQLGVRMNGKTWLGRKRKRLDHWKCVASLFLSCCISTKQGSAISLTFACPSCVKLLTSVSVEPTCISKPSRSSRLHEADLTRSWEAWKKSNELSLAWFAVWFTRQPEEAKEAKWVWCWVSKQTPSFLMTKCAVVPKQTIGMQTDKLNNWAVMGWLDVCFNLSPSLFPNHRIG